MNAKSRILSTMLLVDLSILLVLSASNVYVARAQDAGPENPTGDTIPLTTQDLPNLVFQTPDGWGALPSDLADQSGGPPLINDAFHAPDLPKNGAPSSSGSSAPGYYDTSSYMIGSIAVGIILPESTGNNQNWTTTLRDSVYSEITAGLDRWRAWGVTYNTNVSFAYEYYYAIPTTYEPIEQSSTNECLWIAQVMTSMGYSGSTCYDQVRNYDNNLRTRLGTDWAVTIFVVNSINDADGRFTDNFFAYAYYGGPFIMMTYDNGGWGIGSMDLVAQHEMAHTFWAGDNYYQAGYGGCQSTTETFGYLGIANSNCAYNNPGADTNVLMNNNNPNRVHWTTLFQVGWRDLNSNSRPDPVDTLPGIALNPYSPNPTTNPQLTYTGTAYDNPLARVIGNWYPPNDVTINKIASVQYRVDGGTLLGASPVDGTFNTDYEQFTFSTSALAIGSHTIAVQATNSRGNISSTWLDTVVIGASYSIAGYVRTAAALAIPGVTLTGLPGSPVTNASGYYSAQVASGWSGTVTPARSGYTFTPASISYTNVVSNQTDQNYTAVATATFADVPTTHWAWDWIERLYNAGITSGCGTNPLVYCPEDPVTRAQMAIFLERGINGSAYSPPAATGIVFADVPLSYWAANWIEKLYADGITTGCGTSPLVYCPESSVTRAQMAILLLRAKYGAAYTPPNATGVFADVPLSYWAANWIERLYADGITSGCGTSLLVYCPDDPVTRAQMAVFLVRTFNLP
ncbi:MAG: S-layer homology domain-containing protein [Anaerolineales bacterium]|nr:S-layer homology domain-containing protein [Anaerolineales bacterium]